MVDPAGDRNLEALETAHGGAHGVESIDDIDDGTIRRARDTLEELSREALDHEIDGDGWWNSLHTQPARSGVERC